MVQQQGQLRWHRLFVGRALWHTARPGKVGSPTRQLPFCGCHHLQIFVYDTVTKCRHSSAHVDDKRTAIDLTILKSDLARQQGQVRWVQGVNMIADSLTKKMSPWFLRRIMELGQWTQAETGHESLIDSQKKVGPV